MELAIKIILGCLVGSVSIFLITAEEQKRHEHE